MPDNFIPLRPDRKGQPHVHSVASRRPPSAPFDERRLARRHLLHQMRLARLRGQTTLRVSMRVLEALRPSIVTSLGDTGAAAGDTTASTAERRMSCRLTTAHFISAGIA